MTKTPIAALVLVPMLAAAGAQLPPIPPSLATHTLDNGTVRASIADAIGGRLLSFALVGKANFLKVDSAAGDPDARVDAATDNVGYLGHEVWIGPQKQWWSHQDVNPARAAANADWPPDPYLSLARYTVVRADRAGVTLASAASPVNGLQLDKRYSLVPGQPHSLRLEVAATNRRRAGVAWDIWFNTRVHGDTRVYVPVARREDVRQQAIEKGPDIVPLAWTLADGVLSIDMPAPDADGMHRKAVHRNGKLSLQPSGGWMAGFRDGMALVIRFALQPKAAIHPDQGQVELYNDDASDAPANSLLEMEVHAPYRQLAPGARMAAAETWTLLPYDGPDTRAAHLDFLRSQAQALGLAGIGAAP